MTGRLLSVTPTREFEAVYEADGGHWRELLDAIGVVDCPEGCKVVGLLLAGGSWWIAEEVEGYYGMVRAGEAIVEPLDGELR